MDADLNNKQPCQCELCHPNWNLGRSEDEFEAQPAEAPVRRVTLEDHLAKVLANQFAAATN